MGDAGGRRKRFGERPAQLCCLPQEETIISAAQMSMAAASQMQHRQSPSTPTVTHPGIRPLFSSLASTCADRSPPTNRMLASNTLEVALSLIQGQAKKHTNAAACSSDAGKAPDVRVGRDVDAADSLQLAEGVSQRRSWKKSSRKEHAPRPPQQIPRAGPSRPVCPASRSG